MTPSAGGGPALTVEEALLALTETIEAETRAKAASISSLVLRGCDAQAHEIVDEISLYRELRDGVMTLWERWSDKAVRSGVLSPVVRQAVLPLVAEEPEPEENEPVLPEAEVTAKPVPEFRQRGQPFGTPGGIRLPVVKQNVKRAADTHAEAAGSPPAESSVEETEAATQVGPQAPESLTQRQRILQGLAELGAQTTRDRLWETLKADWPTDPGSITPARSIFGVQLSKLRQKGFLTDM